VLMDSRVDAVLVGHERVGRFGLMKSEKGKAAAYLIILVVPLLIPITILLGVPWFSVVLFLHRNPAAGFLCRQGPNQTIRHDAGDLQRQYLFLSCAAPLRGSVDSVALVRSPCSRGEGHVDC